MQKGRERNDKIKFIKRIVLMTLIMVGLYFFGVWTLHKDAELMKINYCWDENGEHYVAPNPACR